MKKWETVEDIEADIRADVEAYRAARQKHKAPALTVVTDHKLSVEVQRERVSRDMNELIEAEKNRQLCIESYRQRMERQRAEGLYYRQLYESITTAEYWSKQRDDDPARRGEYDPMARFEQQIKDGM
jgi:hypothetical protein